MAEFVYAPKEGNLMLRRIIAVYASKVQSEDLEEIEKSLQCNKTCPGAVHIQIEEVNTGLDRKLLSVTFISPLSTLVYSKFYCPAYESLIFELCEEILEILRTTYGANK
jgi:hypothetical protein